MSFRNVVLSKIYPQAAQWKTKQRNKIEAFQKLTSMPLISSQKRRLGAYAGSHDSLMRIIYKKETAELPIRF